LGPGESLPLKAIRDLKKVLLSLSEPPNSAPSYTERLGGSPTRPPLPHFPAVVEDFALSLPLDTVKQTLGENAGRTGDGAAERRSAAAATPTPSERARRAVER